MLAAIFLKKKSYMSIFKNIAIILLLLSCGKSTLRSSRVDNKISPNLIKKQLADSGAFTPILKTPTGDKIALWATYYYTPIYKNKNKGFALKNMNNKDLYHQGQRVLLSQKEWCMSAMEGSVSIQFSETNYLTYNYAGVSTRQVDCSPYFGNRHRATEKVRFRTANSKWGDGVLSYSLIPGRTIAVDPKVIAYGSVIYISAAKNIQVNLGKNKFFIHDGYFFAGDTGGAIKKNHIDVFIGNNQKNPFGFIKSNPRGIFNGIIVKDFETIKLLKTIHLKKY